jgi:hypothetical protein
MKILMKGDKQTPTILDSSVAMAKKMIGRYLLPLSIFHFSTQPTIIILLYFHAHIYEYMLVAGGTAA